MQRTEDFCRKQATRTLHPQSPYDPKSTYPPLSRKPQSASMLNMEVVAEQLLSCSYLRWRIQLWTFGWDLWHTAQCFTTSTICAPEWKQPQLLTFVLKPLLSPWADLPNPTSQEMSNPRNLFCHFWWCFHHTRTLSLAKMVLLLNKGRRN